MEFALVKFWFIRSLNVKIGIQVKEDFYLKTVALDAISKMLSKSWLNSHQFKLF